MTRSGKPGLLTSSFINTGTEAINLLTGAYRIEFDLDNCDAALRQAAADARSLLIEHVGYQGDTTNSSEAEAFRWKWVRHVAYMERRGYGYYGELALRSNGESSIPTAIVSVRKLPPEKRVVLPRTLAREEPDDPDHFVWWDGISESDLVAYDEELSSGRDERAMHRLLESRPVLLVQGLNSGHGRWVFPRRWLGKDLEIDFLLATRDSAGFEWTAVELEPPHSAPYTKKGRPSARLNEAVHQIQQWRDWLRQNLDYARREKSDRGLGLTDISARCHAIVLIGREWDHPASQSEWRRARRDDDGIEIHSYDWIARNVRQRIRSTG